MRVIGGRERGRKLTAPRGRDTRPATARVRASVFSRLASRNAIAGASVLDVFAGSGSFGLEALSRGASQVVFVDRARAASAAIVYNLSQLHFADRARVITADFRRALAELAEAGQCFGLVFVDAPFGADSTAEVLALIAALGLLAPDGLLVARQFHRTPAPMAAAFECVNVAKIGDHRIALYRRLLSDDTSESARTSSKGTGSSPRDAGMSERTRMVNKSKTLTAIYPGSFDPIHFGHIDVIRRSVAIFDEVIVAIAYNPHKDSALFSPDERVEMIRESIRDLEPRARVDKFSGLSVDYAERIGASVIIRSLRAVTDFDYELQMAQMNKHMIGSIETIFLFANPKLFFSASRLIKEVAGYGKRLPELVPEPVMNRLRVKLKVD